MNWKTALLAALSLFTALLVQRSALPLILLPGGCPLPMVVIIAAFALVTRPVHRLVIGFWPGCSPTSRPRRPAASGARRSSSA